VSRDALLTDLYQLTMLAAYHDLGRMQEATFELFARRLPRERGFLLVAGLEPLLEYVEALAFDAGQLGWLAGTGRFRPAFIDWLADFRFRGEIHAVPEGTVLFADEPWLRVSASLPEAQFIESRLMNLMHFSTLVASKAARCLLAAGSRRLVDFGLRRSHGAEAALLAARASYLAGFAGTATVEAGRRYGIPIFGTMAHSFVQAHDDEAEAFAGYARAHPEEVNLLIDTYDVEAAAREVVALSKTGVRVRGVRIDSGDLGALATRVRAILDAGGCQCATIIASGNLDEFEIGRLVGAGAPIDSFGVGTRLDTSADAPYLDCAYKLEEYAGRPRRKRSTGKATWPGRKQVWRRHDAAGRIAGDVVALEGEDAEGEPLLRCVMRAGRRVAAPETLEAVRARSAASLLSLPDAACSLDAPRPLVATISSGIRAAAARLDREHARA
jgi:nicotinate phosphoribosyltransferase